jgi:WD40 repeat protein
MKINIISLTILAFFLFGCGSVPSKVTSTFTPASTKIIQPTETPVLLSTPTILPKSTELELTTISKENQVIIKGLHTFVRWLFWSKDGKKLFIGTQYNGLVIYDMVDRKMSAHFKNGSMIAGLALSPDENIFAVAIPYNDSVRLIDSETGELIKTLHIANYWASALSFSPDSKVLASYNDRYHETILWDVATGEEIKRLENSGGRQFFSLDGKSFTTSTPLPDDAFRVWNTNTWEIQETIHCKILGVSSFSPDRNRFAVFDTETKEVKVGVWNFKSCKKLFNLNVSQPEPYSVSYNAYDTNGKYMAAGVYSVVNQKTINTVAIWNANTGKHIRDLITGYHDVTIFPLAFNIDGSKLAAAAQDEGGGIVIIWDLTQ